MTAAVKPVGVRTMAGQVRGLRISALAGLVMLLIEYGLGVWTNLYAQLPSSDLGKATLAAFAGAVAHGPAGLTLHALLGTLLIVNAVLVVVRAALVRQTAPVVLGTVALHLGLRNHLVHHHPHTRSRQGASRGLIRQCAPDEHLKKHAPQCHADRFGYPTLLIGAGHRRGGSETMPESSSPPLSRRIQAKVMGIVNIPMRHILKLPFPTTIGKRLMLVYLTGRRTGKQFRQPVG